MATLVLTAVGSVFGPVGAAIGGLLGNAIDGRLLRPKGREGPRLTELKLQTSSYGQPIPRLYGTMRVAGSVIWATDLKETRAKSGGGKGKPSTTTYSYSASFAVLLSARRVQSVGRIWADGKLLRGAAGDFKSGTGFRLHIGGEEQAVDPLIAAAEGAGLTPAMRGQAYAVFEDLQLADFGNRIPSLTFEVTADASPVAVGAIAHDLAGASGLSVENGGTALTGFSAYGDSLRAVLDALGDVDGAWFASGASGVAMRSGTGAAIELADQGVGADKPGAIRVRTLTAGDNVPHRIAVAHYDPARDYQAGLQRARRPGRGVSERRIDLPAALSADDARTLAVAALARAEVVSERRVLTVAPDAVALATGPGDRVRIIGESGPSTHAGPGLWRVARWTLEAMVVRLELVRIAPGTLAVAGASGRVSAAPDQVHGPTILHAFEIPPVDDAVLAAPRIMVAAAGGPGWRQAALLLSLNGGASWSGAGAALVPATLGTVAVPPPSAGSALFDLMGALEVQLAHDGMALVDADGAMLDAGANLALAGDELIQFGRAARIGPGRWRLTRLLRGRRGTESAAGAQAVGDRFVMIEPDALVPIDLPIAALGTEIRLLASGVGDLTGPAEAALTLAGGSVAPPAPVDLRWVPQPDGGAVLHWTRRSRAGWGWADGGDVALVEGDERYRVILPAREEITAEPLIAITAAERAVGGAISVRQIGALAESRAATTTIPE